MKTFILLSFLGIAAAQISIQVPMERLDQLVQQTQWNQPQQNQWNQENNWDFRRPVNQPQQQPQTRPWNQQVIRVPPQPVEHEPWLLRPENRCPEPGDSYHWALIIPHWRDQQTLTLCMGGIGSELKIL